MDSRQVKLLLGALVLAAFTTEGYGQTAAKIFGTVHDQTGQAVKGANIDAHGQKSGEKRQLATDASGSFTLADLPPDTYQISAGCDTCSDVSSIVEVGAGQTRNVQLAVETGSASTVVQLDTSATTMDVSSATLGMNVSGTELAMLPVNGRTFAPIALGAPLVTNSQSALFSNLRFAGQSDEQNHYSLDGIDASSVVSAAPGFVPVEGYEFRLKTSVEAVDEFRVDSVGYPSQDGFGAGGQIKLVSKAATDGWHGSAYEYFRNDNLDARNYFDGAGPSELRMNQFGANGGGDLLKDKLFVFGSFESLRQGTEMNAVESVLSADARARAEAAVLPVVNAMPAGTSTADPDVDQAQDTAMAFQNEWNTSVRLDYLASVKQRFFVRYSSSGGTLDTPDFTVTPRSLQAVSRPDQSVASWSDQLSANLINQLAIGLNRAPTRLSVNAGVSALNGSRILVGNDTAGGFASPGNLMRLTTGLYSSGATFNGRSYNLRDTLDWQRGNHSVQFGGETSVRRMPFSSQGGLLYSVRDSESLITNDDVDVTDFPALPTREAAQEQYAGFVNDQWKLNSHWMVVLGLRYEFASATREIDNRASLFNYSTFTSSQANGGFYAVSKHEFEPRLAMTWSPARFNGKTVLRVGAGLYEGSNPLLDTLIPIENRTPALFLRGASFPTDASAITFNPAAIAEPRALDLTSIGLPQRNYVLTASVQQALPGKLVGQAAYTGILSRHLTQEGIANSATGINAATGDAIRPDGAYSYVPYLTNGGNSHYDALQLGVNRHLVDNLTVTATYNWAHSIGDAQGAGDEVLPQNPLCLACEKGDNNFDVRQSLSANGVYSIPYGKNRRHPGSGWMAATLGGWDVAGIWNLRSGLPVNVTIDRSDEIFYSPSTKQYYSPSDPAVPNNAFYVVNAPGGLEGSGVLRPNAVPGVDPYLHGAGQLLVLNPAAFATPLAGTMGNVGRNALRGPGFQQFDMGLSRMFNLAERTTVQFRMEAFNLFNHANFSNPTTLLPDTTIDRQPGNAFSKDLAAGFGALTSTLGRSVGLGTSRQLQLSLRLQF